jgi:hypothetical protein
VTQTPGNGNTVLPFPSPEHIVPETAIMDPIELANRVENLERRLGRLEEQLSRHEQRFEDTHARILDTLDHATSRLERQIRDHERFSH